METHHKENRYFLTAVFSLMIGIFILLLVAVIWLTVNLNKNWPEDLAISYRPLRKPIVPVNKGKLMINVKESRTNTNFAKNEPIILIVTADSDNQPISGYDASLKYDGATLQFVKAVSLRPDFQIFTDKSEENMIVVTGAKKLSARADAVFTNTSLVELTFRAKPMIAGFLPITQAQFNLSYTPNSTTDSNLITADNKDILSKVEGLTVFIGN